MAASLENVRFLIVDDNVHMLDIVKTMLRGFGANVIFEAKSQQEAWARMRHDNVDIVILDYMIGEDNGVAFLKRLRTDPDSPAPFAPVIMLTAHADKTRVEAARDAGVNEFCAKPVTATELIRKVAAVIDHPRRFVRSGSYIGPDRRRREDPDHEGQERRQDRDAAKGPGDRKA